MEQLRRILLGLLGITAISGVLYLLAITLMTYTPGPQIPAEALEPTPITAEPAPAKSDENPIEKAKILDNTDEITEPSAKITLDARNTVILREVVTEASLAPIMLQMFTMSAKLKKSDIIYLVLDTPGGSVSAGNNFISFAQSLPQKVQTLTIMAASMGFHIAQNLDDRLILPSGTMMSHRASIGGLAGEIPGDAVTKIEFLLRMITISDIKVAKRLGMSLQTYRNMIQNEYWVTGGDGVSDKVADKVVLASCSQNLKGTTVVVVRTFFGAVKVTFSKCPLIRAPLKVELPRFKTQGRKQQERLSNFINALYNNKRSFVETYIISNSYTEFVK